MKKQTNDQSRRILTRTVATLVSTESLTAVAAGVPGGIRAIYTTCGGPDFDMCDSLQ